MTRDPEMPPIYIGDVVCRPGCIVPIGYVTRPDGDGAWVWTGDEEERVERVEPWTQLHMEELFRKNGLTPEEAARSAEALARAFYGLGTT